MSRKTILLSQACEGMIRYKQATGKSENTIADYRVTFKKLLEPVMHFWSGKLGECRGKHIQAM